MEEQVELVMSHIVRQVKFYMKNSPGNKEVALVNLDSVVEINQDIIQAVGKKMIGFKVSGKTIQDVFLAKTNTGLKVIVSW